MQNPADLARGVFQFALPPSALTWRRFASNAAGETSPVDLAKMPSAVSLRGVEFHLAWGAFLSSVGLPSMPAGWCFYNLCICFFFEAIRGIILSEKKLQFASRAHRTASARLLGWAPRWCHAMAVIVWVRRSAHPAATPVPSSRPPPQPPRRSGRSRSPARRPRGEPPNVFRPVSCHVLSSSCMPVSVV